jgi:hypothetical protein
MPSYRTVDCRKWAEKFLRNAGPHARLLRIRPKRAFVIGGIKMPPRMQMEYPWPPWHEHYAVSYLGKIHDEAFPGGLDERQYKERFEFLDSLEFTPV